MRRRSKRNRKEKSA